MPADGYGSIRSIYQLRFFSARNYFYKLFGHIEESNLACKKH
ncbi:hypothetical protein MARINOS108_90130 [Marinoscillum sp. 108]|nr:hypothetical protein MARINOS108_90130 [Marinoscillum sp. 108]